MSNSIVIKEPKRAVDKPKSSQTSGLNNIEKTIYDNNQLLKKNVDAMQKMANSMVESQKTTKSIDKELNSLKEKIIALRKQKTQKATTPERPSSSGSSTTTHKASHLSGTTRVGESVVNKATTPGAAMSTVASVALAVGTGGILNPVIIKALGLDVLVSSMLRGGYNVLKKTPKAIGSLLGFGSNSQAKTSGTTSSNAKATKDAKLHKKLDTIINILEKTKNTAIDKKDKEKKPGLLSKLFGLLTSSGFLKAALAIGAGIAAWKLLSNKLDSIIDKIKNIFGLNNFDPSKLPSMPAPILPTKPKSKPTETPKDTASAEKSKAKELEKKLRKTFDNDIKKITEDYKSKIDSLKKEYDSKIKELTKEIDTLKKNLDNKTKSFNDQIKKQKEMTEKEKTELKKQLEEQKKIIKEKEKNIENTKKEYEKKLQEQKKAHENEIKEKEKALKSKKENIDNKIKDSKVTEKAKTNVKAVNKAKISPSVSSKGTVGLNLGKYSVGKFIGNLANAEFAGEIAGNVLVKAKDVKENGIDTASIHSIKNLNFASKIQDEVVKNNEKLLKEAFPNAPGWGITIVSNLAALGNMLGMFTNREDQKILSEEANIASVMTDTGIALAGSVKELINNPVKVENSTQLNTQDYPSPADSSFAITNDEKGITIISNNKTDPNKPSEQDLLTEILQELKQQNLNKPLIINETNQTSATPFSNSDFVNVF